MAAIVDYATLTTEIGAHMKRTYSASDTDGFIGNAEGEFRLYLPPNYTLEIGAASVTFTNGIGALPAGFVRPISLTIAGVGPVSFVALGTVRNANLFGGTGNPQLAAISGSSIITTPTYTGSVALDYEGALPGLSGLNTTNWLVLNAPQTYLKMCLSYANARLKSLDQANAFRSAALQDLQDLGIQSLVAQQGRGTVTIPGPTP
jgi:hypothetical protein